MPHQMCFQCCKNQIFNVATKDNFFVAKKLNMLMPEKYNILISQKKRFFGMSQKLNFLFYKQAIYYVAKSEFFNTRRVIT